MRIAVSLVPGLLFLAGLWYLDNFRLVTIRRVFEAVGIGAAIALLLIPFNGWAIGLAGAYYPHAGAPLVEEFCKALPVLYWIARNRAGFAIDAGVLGFSVGAGFAQVENIYYLDALPGQSILLWAIRGCGTAMMHGAATACGAILARTLTARRGFRAGDLWQGLAVAVAFHMAHNSGLASTVVTAELTIVAGFALLFIVFGHSERNLTAWLHAGLDRDIETWSAVEAGEFPDTSAGNYLRRLGEHFGPEQLKAIRALVKLSIEVGAQAKGDMIRRRCGLPVTPDPAVPLRLARMAELEAEIGRGGMMALAPLLGPLEHRAWEKFRAGNENPNHSLRGF